MRLNIIACINQKRALGKNGDLLYKISNDLRNFKKITNGGIVIMGKNTWNSLPIKPLPGRANIILSKTGLSYEEDEPINLDKFLRTNFITLNSLDAALSFAEALTAFFTKEDEAFIIGGASLYQKALEKNYVDNLYITEVLDDTEGDVYFPDFEKDKGWKIWFETDPIIDPKSNLKYRYKFYRK